MQDAYIYACMNEFDISIYLFAYSCIHPSRNQSLIQIFRDMVYKNNF